MRQPVAGLLTYRSPTKGGGGQVAGSAGLVPVEGWGGCRVSCTLARPNIHVYRIQFRLGLMAISGRLASISTSFTSCANCLTGFVPSSMR
jgi:hypothetical protein